MVTKQKRRSSKKPIQRSAKKKSVIRLQLQDAFDFLKKLPANSVDLIISSPPYCMGKEYDKSASVQDFVGDHHKLAPLLFRVLRNGGSLCWQVGHYVDGGVVVPLDALVYSIFSHEKFLLRNRIVWTFGHGTHATRRFSGRHETVLWFTKTKKYYFNLNSVRVPQKYPGKRHYKGPNKGELSGNPKGKNPSDVWEIPNVKSHHIEKTKHPCQFPVALAQRLIRSLTKKNNTILDPFMGSGTTAVAAALEGRKFLGCDVEKKYVDIAKKRAKEAVAGKARYRPIERPIYVPKGTEAVSKRPAHFKF